MDIRKYILLILLVFASVTQMQAQADRQFIRNGNKLYRQQNYAKAETEYRKALSKNARNTQAMYNLGCALMMQQKDSAAIVQLQNAGRSEQSPRRKAMVYHNIGVTCQGHQMYGEAIEAYKESLRNNPSDNETRYNLALCQRLQKKQKQNGGKNNQKDKNKKDNKNQQNKQKNNNQNKQGQNNQQKQQPKDQMSKDNAQQLLNYAIQQEKATQERLKRNEQQPQRRRLQQNW